MKYNINIPKPCHEDWNAMLPEQKGRHCEACKTVVTDFTIMTDAEIISHLKASSSNTCGRFLDTQLNRNLIEPTKTYDWFSIPKLSAAASILFSLLQLPVFAQNKNEVRTEQTQVLKNDSLKIDTIKHSAIKTLPVRDVNSVVPIYQGMPSSAIQIGGSRQNGTRIIVDGVTIKRTLWQRFKRKIRKLF
jgi:hypothetical protein